LLPAKQKSPEPGREVPLPQGFPLLDDVVAKAKQEQKLVVLDVSAKWCVPCWQMKRTFTDAKVKALLDRTVWIKIDTDEEPDLSKRLGESFAADLESAIGEVSK
jgi:thiol:disulfide interchange protein